MHEARRTIAGSIRLALAVALAILTTAGVTLLCSPPAASASVAGRAASSPAAARPLSAGVVCRHLRAHFGTLSLAGRSRLKILVTGDSMIYPISEELSIAHPHGVQVAVDRHDGTGLTVRTVDWHGLARRQVARFHQDATVISLGGRDGGIPLRDSGGHLVECCGTAWLGLYAALLRPLAVAYARHGHGHVYWLTIPAPREKARAPFYEAVNQAVKLLATQIGPSMHVVPVDAAVSPGGFQDTISYEGLTIAPRSPDGIHLDHAGACVERSLVVEAMLSDGLLKSSTIHALSPP